jgi:hypothetical protein
MLFATMHLCSSLVCQEGKKGKYYIFPRFKTCVKCAILPFMIPLTCTGGKERGFGKLAKISVRKTLGKIICDKNNFWNAQFVYSYNLFLTLKQWLNLLNYPSYRQFLMTSCFVHRVDAKAPVSREGTLIPSFLYTVVHAESRSAVPVPLLSWAGAHNQWQN